MEKDQVATRAGKQDWIEPLRDAHACGEPLLKILVFPPFVWR
jgi:hypothetical protein